MGIGAGTASALVPACNCGDSIRLSGLTAVVVVVLVVNSKYRARERERWEFDDAGWFAIFPVARVLARRTQMVKTLYLHSVV